MYEASCLEYARTKETKAFTAYDGQKYQECVLVSYNCAYLVVKGSISLEYGAHFVKVNIDVEVLFTTIVFG